MVELFWILWAGGFGEYNMQNFSTGEIIIDTIGSIENYDISTTEHDDSYCFYQDEDGQTIFTLWFLFAGEDLLTMGIDEYFLTKEFSEMMPNPFDETFSIKGVESPQDIRIHDILGNKIPYQISGNLITPLTDKGGIYFISFNANGKSYNFKSMKK